MQMTIRRDDQQFIVKRVERSYRVAMSFREAMEASRTEGASSAKKETITCIASAKSTIDNQESWKGTLDVKPCKMQ